MPGVLAWDVLFEAKAPGKMYQGLVYADVLCRGIQICKFQVEVVYEGPNFVEPVKSWVASGTGGGVVVKEETQDGLKSCPGHGSRVHGHVMNWVRGPI